MICPNCKKENMNAKATECVYCHTPFYSNQEQAAEAVKNISKSEVLGKLVKVVIAIIVVAAVLLGTIFIIPKLPKKESGSNNGSVNSNSQDFYDDSQNDNSSQTGSNSTDSGNNVSKPSENNNNTGSTSSGTENNISNSTQKQPVKTYKTGETWTVPNLWKITFKGAAMHYFCNMHDDGNGAENCVVLIFDIENIGSDTIYFTCDVYDEKGEKATSYPCMHDDGIVSIASGGKQTGIKAAYSLKNSSSYVVVNVVKSVNINGKYEKYEAKFKVSISTGEGNVGAENNAPLPKDVSYYTEHPQVPDFGAMLGIEPMSVERSGGVVGYSYDAASKDSSGKVVKDYVALLERCGYTYAGGGYMDDGNSIVYYDNNTYGWRVGITTTAYSLLIMVSKK